MKKLFTLISMLAFVLSISAQGLDARGVLDRTSALFQGKGGIRMVAEFTSMQGNDQVTISLMGKKFVMDSNGMKTWFDGQTQWSYLPDMQEVTITHPTPQELQLINPYTFLSMYKKGYRLRWGEQSAGQAYYDVVMEAEAAQEPYCMEIRIKKSNFHPMRIRIIQQKGGDAIELVVKEFRSGLTLADDFFTFKPSAYPGVEVIDLR